MNKALINYYARLIKKETYTMDDVPEENREDVQAALDAMDAEAAADESVDETAAYETEVAEEVAD